MPTTGLRLPVRLLPQALVLLSAACAGAGTAAHDRPAALDLPGFHVLGPTVAGGGQPSVGVIGELAEAGYGLVINLRGRGEPLAAEEGELVRAAGLAYAAMPMDGDDLTAAHAHELAELLAAHPDRHVLLHCAGGNRVGALWGLYVGLRDGLGVDRTLEVARAAGMRSPALAECVRSAVEEAAGGP